MEELVRVEVITSPTKLNGFKKAISKIGVTGMTVSQVMGCGVQKGTPEYEDEIHDEIELLPKQMIMMVLEKDKLKKVLEKRGYTILMTREEDKGLYEENTKNMKAQDLQNRIAMIKEYKKHFKNPDIRKHCLKHEELLACYPKLWSEEVAGCCGF